MFDGWYVPYCMGPGYAYHVRTFELMAKNAHTVPILKNEDALLTGLCLRR